MLELLDKEIQDIYDTVQDKIDVDKESLKRRIERAEELFSSLTKFNNAPTILFDNMSKLAGIIEKHKSLKGEDDAYLEYKKIVDGMKYALLYINDLKSIYEENLFLTSYNRTMTIMLSELRIELDSYKSIEESMLNGSLIDKMKTIKERL